MIDDTKALSRLTLHEFYTMEENIDIVVIGASSSVRAIDPAILDSELSQNTFNLSTVSQQMNEKYYLLKELFQNHNPKQVYISVDFSVLSRPIGNEAPLYIVSDYMKNGRNRLELIFNSLESDKYLNAFSRVIRNREELTCKDIVQIVTEKSTDAYRSYMPIEDERSVYKGKGFDYFKSGNELDVTALDSEIDIVDVTAFDKDEIKYLENAIQLCKEKGTDVTLVVMPYTEYYVDKSLQYEEFDKYMEEFSKANNVSFYDFNLCKVEFLQLENSDFYNLAHVNLSGAEKTSQFMAELILTNNKDNMFYESISEKRGQSE